MNRRPAPIVLSLALAVLALAGTTAAQELGRLLPAETVVAVQVRDLAAHEAKLEDFVAEFERLGVGDALVALAADGASDAEVDPAAALEKALQAVDPLALFGHEAWFAVSFSGFSPIPTATLLARPAAEALADVEAAIARAAAGSDVETLQEGGATFYVARFDDPELPVAGAAWTLHDGVLALSTDPEGLRGVLRRLAGAQEPGFAGSDAHDATLGRLEPGNLSWFVDYGRFATSVAPLLRGFGFETLVERLERAFVTAGAAAGTVRLVDDGTRSASVQAVNESGGDVALYGLLTRATPAPTESLRFVPDDAISVTATGTDLEAWWNYLDDLVRSVPELGLRSLDEATAMVGVDLRAGLFDWVAPGVTFVTAGIGEAAVPGVPSQNMLGETVIVLGAEDPAAAQAGLDGLFTAISQTAAAFADPTGGAGAAQGGTRDVAGASVTTVAPFPGVSLSYAVVGDHAVIATSDEAMDAALRANAAGGGLPPVLASLRDAVPRGATSFTLADDRAGLEGAAGQVASQLQATAGLTGGAGIDFDAVANASASFEAYLRFVASRLGGSASYSVVEGSTIRGESSSDIRW